MNPQSNHESLIKQWLANNEREYQERKHAPLTEGQVLGEAFNRIFNTVEKKGELL